MNTTPAARFARNALCLAILTAPSTAFAALGGTASSVDADRIHAQGALMRMVRVNEYEMHEIRSGTGTMIREYVNASGTVFAVAWEGPWMPDLQQVLGDHFAEFQAAQRGARTARRARGVLSINQPGLVVQMTGHMRALIGRAYVPGLLPSGVQLDAIR
jgi:Protein of unknown function (DUF2844)